MGKKKLLIFALTFALLLGGAGALYRYLSASHEAEQLAAQGGKDDGVRIEAPDFTVYDLSGGEVHLSDFRGKPVVLNFWASWCGPCQSEMPDFDEAYRELDGAVEFLMINLTDGERETVFTAAEYVEEKEFALPVYFDSTDSAATAYKVYSIPSTFFIDAEGYAVAKASGAIPRATLDKGIGMIYAGK